MKKKILIIGGGGYIGNALIDNLSKKKFNILIFDNLIYGQKFSKKVKFIPGDIRKNKDIQKISAKYYAVIYLAGLVGDPITKKYKRISKIINEKFTKKLIFNFYKNGNAEKFIFVSTCSNYGFSKSNNLKEDDNLNPLSLYAKSKVKIEKFLLNLKKKKDFSPTILRFATAFGLSGRMRFDLTVNQFTRDLYKKKYLEVYDFNTWRPYCHVKDFARLIEKIITKEKYLTDYEVFNCGGNSNNFTKKQISKKIQKYTGGKITFLKKFLDKRNYVVDFSKVRKKLNFKPKFTVDYGIKEILKDLKKNKSNLNNQNLGNYKIKI